MEIACQCYWALLFVLALLILVLLVFDTTENTDTSVISSSFSFGTTEMASSGIDSACIATHGCHLGLHTCTQEDCICVSTD